MDFNYLKQQDLVVAEALEQELRRQQDGLELIAAENYVSRAVLEALGSVATNKYAEGYPGRRYYGGNQFIDVLEQTAIDRAKELFGAEHVNVQPLSGAAMNLAVYFAFLKPGDTVLGMDLSHGGHLTHGHPVTYVAKLYNFVRYKCDPETGAIDYDEMLALAREHRPKIVLAGFSSYSRSVDYDRVHAIAQEVGAVSMMDMAHIAGLVAGGVLANPVPIMDVVTTTTHKTLRGPRGGMILCKNKFAAMIDKSVFPGMQGGPHQNNIAALAVALKEAGTPEFRKYAQQVIKNARALCEVLRASGAKILFGGTDNHIVLVDVTAAPFNLTGQEAESALDATGITVNKNIIPNDPRKPMNPSGIRLGTPALTTRGMREKEMQQIGEIIARILRTPKDPDTQNQARALVSQLTTKFPIYS